MITATDPPTWVPPALPSPYVAEIATGPGYAVAAPCPVTSARPTRLYSRFWS